MPPVSGIYDSDYVQASCKVRENLSIWTSGKWKHYHVEMIEPFPAGPDNQVDMVALAGLTALPASGTIAKRVVAALQLNDTEMLHLRWCPIDFVAGRLWEQAGQTKFATARTHPRVDPFTVNFDPFFSSTTFWIVGSNRDMNLETLNPIAVAIPAARFQFWGLRYILTEYTKLAGVSDTKEVMAAIGPTTWLPGEYRAV